MNKIQRGDIVQSTEVDSIGIVIRRDFSGLIEIAMAPEFNEKWWCAENKWEVVGHVDD